MKKSWAVTIKVEHEYYYDPTPQSGKSGDTCNLSAVGLNTLKVERIVNGDDEACDAAWAILQATSDVRDQYNISNPVTLHVIEAHAKEVE